MTGWILVRTIDRADVHAMPLGDYRDHVPERDCWCKPTIDEEAPHVLVHHAVDRRQEYERGEKVLS